MRLPNDSSQQDPSARRRLFKVRLRHRLPSQRDQQLVCRCGGVKMHIGFGQFFFFFLKPLFSIVTVIIKKNSQSFRAHLFVASGSFWWWWWWWWCGGVLAVFLCKQGRVGSARRRYGAASRRRTWLNVNARGHSEDGATGALWTPQRFISVWMLTGKFPQFAVA